jgi:hydrogenase/urease accessory protein HupE
MNSMVRAQVVFSLVFFSILLLELSNSSGVHAHEVRLSVLSLKFSSETQAVLSWKGDQAQSERALWIPRIPEGCQPARRALRPDFELVSEIALACNVQRIDQIELRIDYRKKSTERIIVRIETAAGHVVRGILSPSTPSFRAPLRKSSLEETLDYLALGCLHLLSAYDHLAFILALFFLLGWGWSLLTAVSAFTVGHSITLAWASLSVVKVPSVYVESAIAVSIMVLALEMVRNTRARRYTWLWAVGFGLLHGLGFASALREVGSQAGPILWPLLGFNLGIEIAQIAILGGFGFLCWCFGKELQQSPQLRSIASYLIGAVGANALLAQLWRAFC